MSSSVHVAVSFAAAAAAAFPPTVSISVARGCLVTACQNTSGFASAEEAAKGADIAVLQVGLSSVFVF